MSTFKFIGNSLFIFEIFSAIKSFKTVLDKFQKEVINIYFNLMVLNKLYSLNRLIYKNKQLNTSNNTCRAIKCFIKANYQKNIITL